MLLCNLLVEFQSLNKKPISPAARRKTFGADLFQIADQKIGKNLSGRKNSKRAQTLWNKAAGKFLDGSKKFQA